MRNHDCTAYLRVLNLSTAPKPCPSKRVSSCRGINRFAIFTALYLDPALRVTALKWYQDRTSYPRVLNLFVIFTALYWDPALEGTALTLSHDRTAYPRVFSSLFVAFTALYWELGLSTQQREPCKKIGLIMFSTIQYWVKQPRHSENVFARKRYTLIQFTTILG